MRDFRSLAVWRKAHALVLRVYDVSTRFPEDERYGLTSQLRLAAASVPTNLAEGCGRDSERELARFVVIASGSASEVEYLLLLARDLGLIGTDLHASLAADATEVKRMLHGLQHALRPPLSYDAAELPLSLDDLAPPSSTTADPTRRADS